MQYGIRVTSWGPFTFNAIHHYGKIWKYEEDGGLLEEHDVEKKLTLREAIALNKKDTTSWLGLIGGGMKAGDFTSRFDAEDEVIAAGVKLITKLWGEDARPIEIGDHFGFRDNSHRNGQSTEGNFGAKIVRRSGKTMTDKTMTINQFHEAIKR